MIDPLNMGASTKNEARKYKIALVLAISVASFYFISMMALRYVQVHKALFGTSVSVSNVSVRELNPTNATIEVALFVRNPSPVDVIIKRIEYKLYLNGEYLGGRNLQKRLVAPSKSGVPIPVETAVGSIRVEIVSEAVQSDEWRWFVDGSLHVINPLRNTVLIPFTINFQK